MPRLRTLRLRLLRLVGTTCRHRRGPTRRTPGGYARRRPYQVRSGRGVRFSPVSTKPTNGTRRKAGSLLPGMAFRGALSPSARKRTERAFTRHNKCVDSIREPKEYLRRKKVRQGSRDVPAPRIGRTRDAVFDGHVHDCSCRPRITVGAPPMRRMDLSDPSRTFVAPIRTRLKPERVLEESR